MPNRRELRSLLSPCTGSGQDEGLGQIGHSSHNRADVLALPA